MFEYFIADEAHPVREADAVWTTPLPTNRPGTDPESGSGFSCGDYFQAIRSFLEYDSFSRVKKALGGSGPSGRPAPAVDTIRIFMEKHGRFYHPARVVVGRGTDTLVLAANLAVTSAGLSLMDRESRCLDRLHRDFNAGHTPRVFACADVTTASRRPTMILLTEWFPGYHEFHQTSQGRGPLQTVVWDPAGHRILSDNEQTGLYRRVAAILTDYYHIDTGEQIFPWHHAAGDFVVRVHQGRLSVKLITARQYAAMVDVDATDSASVMNGLLLFFVNLTIRMRLDRLDGTGETVWAGDTVLADTVTGFFSALSTRRSARFDRPLDIAARDYFSTFSTSELLEIAVAVTDAYDPDAPDLPVVRRNLSDHINLLSHYVSHPLPIGN